MQQYPVSNLKKRERKRWTWHLARKSSGKGQVHKDKPAEWGSDSHLEEKEEKPEGALEQKVTAAAAAIWVFVDFMVILPFRQLF